MKAMRTFAALMVVLMAGGAAADEFPTQPIRFVVPFSAGGPTDTAGRLIAGALMIGGIALLGIVTATLASWLVERVAEQDEAGQAATRKQVADLSVEVRALATRTHRVDLASVDTDSLRRELASRGVVAQHAPSDN